MKNFGFPYEDKRGPIEKQLDGLAGKGFGFITKFGLAGLLFVAGMSIDAYVPAVGEWLGRHLRAHSL